MIETKRLFLRPFKKSDLEPLFNAYNSHYVQQFNMMGALDIDAFHQSLIEQDPRNNLHIEIKETEEVIGIVALDPCCLRHGVNAMALSYWLSEPYSGRGYMTEALQGMIDDCFHRRGIDILSARVFSVNTASRRLLERLSFEQEGYLKHAIRHPAGTVFDDVLYVKFKNSEKPPSLQ